MDSRDLIRGEQNLNVLIDSSSMDNALDDLSDKARKKYFIIKNTSHSHI